MTLQNRIILITGYSTYAILLLSVLLGRPEVIMEYVSYAPAPLFAILVLLFTPRVTINKGVAFFSFCCILYYGQLYFIIEHIIEKNQFHWLIAVMSCTGASLVGLVHSHLFQAKVCTRNDILISAKLGLLASIPTVISSFFGPYSSDLADQLLAIAYYSIFPLWIITISRHLLRDRSA